jgi:hypothetical protein
MDLNIHAGEAEQSWKDGENSVNVLHCVGRYHCVAFCFGCRWLRWLWWGPRT